MVYPQDSHVGASAGATLLHRLRRRVVDLEETDRATGHSASGSHDVASRPQARKGEAGTPTTLVDEGCSLIRLENTVHVIRDREHVAGGVLEPIIFAGVHQRGRIGEKIEARHGSVVLSSCLLVRLRALP